MTLLRTSDDDVATDGKIYDWICPSHFSMSHRLPAPTQYNHAPLWQGHVVIFFCYFPILNCYCFCCFLRLHCYCTAIFFPTEIVTILSPLFRFFPNIYGNYALYPPPPVSSASITSRWPGKTCCSYLTHLRLDKMTAISQTII